MLKQVAVTLLVLTPIGQATASPQETWKQFVEKVEKACLLATANLFTDASAVVDPWGSDKYGLSIVSGAAAGGPASVICVFDKQSEAVEVGSELALTVSPTQGQSTSNIDPNAVRLQQLTHADLDQANLGGELACSFADGDAGPVFFAMGIVESSEPAKAIAKVSGTLQPLTAAGGFNAIIGGAEFSGPGGSVDIAVTGQTDEGGESPARTAILTGQFADGEGFTMDGLWRCGP